MSFRRTNYDAPTSTEAEQQAAGVRFIPRENFPPPKDYTTPRPVSKRWPLSCVLLWRERMLSKENERAIIAFERIYANHPERGAAYLGEICRISILLKENDEVRERATLAAHFAARYLEDT